MPSSCKDIRTGLALCLQRSPCVLIDRHTPTECMENPELRKDLPEQCLARMRSYAQCRRGIFDMSRKRFRGNGPLSTGIYDEEYERISKGEFDPATELDKVSKLL
ncbi:cytochrome c oxidase assembly protein PET191-domain-containing protein [Lipomyces kononenkoae]|uniref:Cytochrome c oxidase assembly protein PET191-domain-containing protein n=1 Tax=Lipomyces kononenkoae TaxID=34357 RepID=A0ACC3SV39_LIPKO